MSDHYSTDDPENLLLSSPRPSNCSSIFSTIGDAVYECLILFAILSVFAVSALFLATSVYLVFHGPESRLNSVFVSSFNVSKNSSETTWDIELSLNHPYFKDLDVTYEARAWLYSRNGVISTSSPSMVYSSEGQELVLHAIFTMHKDDVEEEFSGDKAVILDLLMEANVTRKPTTYQSEMRSFLMIDCNDLKIEFPLNQSLGTLSAAAANNCRVQLCPTKSDALNCRAAKCYEIFYTKYRV